MDIPLALWHVRAGLEDYPDQACIALALAYKKPSLRLGKSVCCEQPSELLCGAGHTLFARICWMIPAHART